VDDSGFPRTPDRSVKLLGTCVRYLRSVKTSIGARGADFLGGSATLIIQTVSTGTWNSIRCALLPPSQNNSTFAI